jgi:hypothetical protein
VRDAPLYRLLLEAVPGPVPAAVRPRRLLKALGRGSSYGFRCRSAQEVRPEEPGADPPAREERSES